MNVNRNGLGKSSLGILMLDTCFPRPEGDIGNPQSFAVSVTTRVVAHAIPAAVVRPAAAMAGSTLVDAFCDAARDLADQGVWAIASSCGFLVLIQAELQSSVPGLPVRTSSLLQLPKLLSEHEKVGVLTIDATALGYEHLLAAGVPNERLADVLIQGVAPHSEFVQKIMGNQRSMDFGAAQKNVVEAALALSRKAPSLKHLVLECTNMPPYQLVVERATGLQCWSLRDDPVLIELANSHCNAVLTSPLRQNRL